MEETVEKKETSKGEGYQNKLFWVIGGIVLIIIGWFGWQLIFSSSDYKVSLVNAPAESVSGNVTTFTWRIDGPSATINHTSVHYGETSNPGILDKNIKPQDTRYTDFVKDFASGKFDIPLQFIGNTTIVKPGKYYFRIHALIKDKNYWSDEYSMEVKPAGDYQISVMDVPKELTAGSIATFTWRIDGAPTTINHTAIYFGEEGSSGKLDKTVRPQDTAYTNFVKDFANGQYDIPFQFIGNEKIATPGSYFYRGYTNINGKNYWTDEGTFKVK